MDSYERRAATLAAMQRDADMLAEMGQAEASAIMLSGMATLPALDPLPRSFAVFQRNPDRPLRAAFVLPDSATPEVRAQLEADLAGGGAAWTRHVNGRIERIDPASVVIGGEHG